MKFIPDSHNSKLNREVNVMWIIGMYLLALACLWTYSFMENSEDLAEIYVKARRSIDPSDKLIVTVFYGGIQAVLVLIGTILPIAVTISLVQKALKKN